MNLHIPNSSTVLPITPCFEFLGVLPTLYLGLIFHINFPFEVNNASSLDSVLTTRATDALTLLLIVCIYLERSSLMKCCSQPSTDPRFLLLLGFQPLWPPLLSYSYLQPFLQFRLLLPLPLPTHLLPLYQLSTFPPSPSDSGSGVPNQLSTAQVSPLQVAPDTTSTQPASLPAPHQMVTRSKTGSLRPKNYTDFQLFYSTRHPFKALHNTLLPEPTYFSEASKSPAWRTAMNQEFDALLTQNTWSLCPFPAGRHAVRNKWVYKLKQQPDGSIERYKARLVAKGFDQRSGIDYTETFSPVIKPATVRVVLAIAVHFNWSISQLDISKAFLHGRLQEEVYMLQPQGFVHPDFPNHVCKLHKAIYGLKQAPRAWFNRLSDSLLDFGFTQSLVDTSLFLFHQGAVHLFILIYVDDILITGTHSTVIQSQLAKLRSDFTLKDLGELSYFLGIQVQQTATSLHLRQSKYILDLLNKARMVGAKASWSPCVTGSKLSSTDGSPIENVTEFRQLVGGLQYCTLTRLEIAYSVNQLCQHLHSPTSTHWTALKRVLRYLKGLVDHGLFYSQGPLTLQAYCDSDWAGDPDDRRSTTGYGVFFGPCLISWCAKKQSVVARSSTEAEYRAMAMATTELYWIRMLL